MTRRTSLLDSLASRHAPDARYVSGSVVLCCACLKPLYVLQRALCSGDKVSRTLDAYRPVTLADLHDLSTRVDAPVVANMLKLWTLDARRAHCESIATLTAGSLALCPSCDRSWVRVRALEASEVIDRAYVWELVTVLPAQPVAREIASSWVC